ncbi:MAG: ribonuclease J [Lachnospiraceae bacterium]|nr:ribonuclease J [Lachnospiraceae bacterium]
MKRKELKKNTKSEYKLSPLKIIPLGGLEQIGMNITAFESEDSIIIVDCGLAFPEDDMFGIDLVIPDTTYHDDNLEKVKGWVITHGHEDHIGALPYVLQKINVPVFATRLTMGIIENKLAERGMLETTQRKVVKFGSSVNLGCFRVEFIKTNHSIVDAAALAIYTPAGIVVHTGDFKVDYTPVFGDAIDLQRFAELGRKGVLALLCDSTNAERPGFTPSEKTVGKTIDQLFQEHSDTRIIIATFASNVDRVQQIINSAYKYGRKVVVEGRSMVNIIATASELGCLNVPENTLISVDQLKNYPGNQTVIITTGSQGESMAALSRMAENIHRKISIGEGDTVIFSSSPIPGNEKAVTNVINKLLLKGADVIFQDVHVSGHPCQEDIKLIYTLVQPKYAIPVHGEYRHLKAQAKLVAELGIPRENIFILQSGNVLEMTPEKAEITGDVPVGNILVDGLGVGDVGNIVLRDRQHLAEDGIVIVAFAMAAGSDLILSSPEITSRGFVYIKEADEMMKNAVGVVEDVLDSCRERGTTDRNRIKSVVRDNLSDFFWKKTQRRPMILPMIIEIDE